MKWYWILLIIIAVVLGAVPNGYAMIKKASDKAKAKKLAEQGAA